MIIDYHIKSQQTSNNTLNYLSLTHYQLSKFGFFRYGVTCQIQKSCDKTDKMAVENRHVEATGPKNSGRWPRSTGGRLNQLKYSVKLNGRD